MPFTLYVRNAEPNAMGFPHEQWDLHKAFPLSGLDTALFAGEFLVGLSFHQIVSPLKALGSIWDVTVGSWASGDGWEALKQQRLICREGAGLLSGLTEQTQVLQAFSWRPYEARHCGGTTIPRLIFPGSPAMGEVDSRDSVTT